LHYYPQIFNIKLAPELVFNLEYGKEVDFYSLGVILYSILIKDVFIILNFIIIKSFHTKQKQEKN